MLKLVSLRASGFKRLDIRNPLAFPDGRLLIHGRNESGKSTLMEAIHYALYGQPLRPTKKAGNEDIIAYTRQDALVELEFTIDETQYKVVRELFKDKNNRHRLLRKGESGKWGRVAQGARKVQQELDQVLHGIDSEALLNSCLVEQKELGKLEDASRQERIRAISSLLNLEAFVEAQKGLKKDSNQLEKTHLQTQNTLEEARRAKEAYEEAERNLAEARSLLEEVRCEREEVAQALQELEKRLEKVERLEKLLGELREVENKIERAEMLLGEKEKNLQEAREAVSRVQELEGLIEDYQPAEQAKETAEKIRSLSNQLVNTAKELSRLEEELAETRDRIKQAQESEKRIRELEEAERQAEETLENTRARRNLGKGVALLGVIALVYSILSSLWMGVAVGASLLMAGGLLYLRSDVGGAAEELGEIRNQLREVLGEKSRIEEFHRKAEALQEEVEKLGEEKTRLEEELQGLIAQLPDRPTEYRALVSTPTPASLEKLFKQVEEDIQTLTAYQAERSAKLEQAGALEEIEASIEELNEEKERHGGIKASLEEKVAQLEEETGVARVQVQEVLEGLRGQQRELDKSSSALEEKAKHLEDTIERSEKTMEENRGLRDRFPALEQQFQEEAFTLEAMGRAVKLLDLARDSIVKGVKQSVEKNMMRFLPTLTDNRYTTARIDEEKYRIEVWDREARRWRGKGVFSGATQDQFSLALRLAFAISTIPTSRGARPGFIFLDEPLTGFDAQRRKGFLRLLREELSKFFDQIIVISHLEELAEEFPQSIHLDQGRIIEVQR